MDSGSPSVPSVPPPARSTGCSRWYGVLSLSIVSALAAAFRLPQFLGGNLFPDGDECIVGLMAAEWLDGGRFPVFYWGQVYGLATLEALAIAFGFATLGYAPLVIKIAMLPLWIVAVWLHALVIRRFSGERAAWFFIVLMLACPAWAGGAMNARGGYLTAFLLSGLALWLIAWSRSSPRGVHLADTVALVLGVIAALVFFAQAIWIPPLLPFLALALWKSRRKLRDLAGFVVGAAPTSFVLAWIVSHQLAAHRPPVEWFGGMGESLIALPSRVLLHLAGAYFLDCDLPAPLWTRVNAILWMGLTVVAVVAALGDWRRRRAFTLAEATLLALLLVLGTTVAAHFSPYAHRYLFPLTALVAILVADLFARAWTAGRWARAGVGAFLSLQVVLAGLNHAEWSYPLDANPRLSLNVPQREVEALADALLQRGVHHVYCLDTLLQYRLIFITRGNLMARSYCLDGERQLQYPLAVERARLEGKPTVLIGQTTRLDFFEESARRHGLVLGDWYPFGTLLFVLPNPSAWLLRALDIDALPDEAALERFVREHAP
ncbi:hypothetical protein JW916_07275 [Candidatus Sumerlaeota bacterium]|nr:hypothetical protein [Candidatus Sumerlaeota bacterium]